MRVGPVVSAGAMSGWGGCLIRCGCTVVFGFGGVMGVVWVSLGYVVVVISVVICC